MVADRIQNHSLTAVTVKPTNAIRSKKHRTFLAHQHYAQGHFIFLYIQQYRFYYYCSLITALCTGNTAIFKLNKVHAVYADETRILLYIIKSQLVFDFICSFHWFSLLYFQTSFTCTFSISW